jgi:hypothetical protein
MPERRRLRRPQAPRPPARRHQRRASPRVPLIGLRPPRPRRPQRRRRPRPRALLSRQPRLPPRDSTRLRHLVRVWRATLRAPAPRRPALSRRRSVPAPVPPRQPATHPLPARRVRVRLAPVRPRVQRHRVPVARAVCRRSSGAVPALRARAITRSRPPRGWVSSVGVPKEPARVQVVHRVRTGCLAPVAPVACRAPIRP